jgi:hypothetical protein
MLLSFFSVLGIEPRVSHMLANYSTTELHCLPQVLPPFMKVFICGGFFCHIKVFNVYILNLIIFPVMVFFLLSLT